MAEPDWSDPCAVALWLRPQIAKVAAGLAVIEVQHGETSTRFGQANYESLNTFYRQMVSECAAASGGRTKRRAFIAG